MLGYEEWEIGDSHAEFVRLLHPDDVSPTLEAIAAHLGKKSPVLSIEYRLRHKDGNWRWIMDRGQAIWDERGRAVRMAGSHTDITDRKRLEDILSLQARTDALTGLPNRWEFDRRFANTFQAARENRTPLSVCICDLDRFKQVNDSHGHAAGDRVLVTFGRILREHLRRYDIPARIGGDEFVLAMPGTSAEAAAEVMERMRCELGRHTFTEAGISFRISSSFGVAPLRDSHRSGQDLIAEADRCLYEAKEAGRNRTLVAV
jgi:diguanylate cyclase (GGDEF)-like protein/PAS domain S-box-containing protein